MNEPSQSKEMIHRAIHRISSRPPPDIIESQDEIPTIEEPSVKEMLRFTIFVVVIVTVFISLIITGIAWQVGYFK